MSVIILWQGSVKLENIVCMGAFILEKVCTAVDIIGRACVAVAVPRTVPACRIAFGRKTRLLLYSVVDQLTAHSTLVAFLCRFC